MYFVCLGSAQKSKIALEGLITNNTELGVPYAAITIINTGTSSTEDVYASCPRSQNPEPTDPKIRASRGGSFMFDQVLEKSFTTTFRAKNSVDTSLFNTGLRCAK